MWHSATATNYRNLLAQLVQLATSDHLSSVDSIAAAGTGYSVGDVLTLIGGTSTHPATIRVTTIGGGGSITGVAIVNGGAYTAAPSDPVSVTGGGGSSATFNLTFTFSGWTTLRYLTQIGLTSVAVSAGGTSYSVNDVLTVVGGTGTAATILVTAVSSGAVTAVSVLTPGSYTVAPSAAFSVTGGGGSGATFTGTFFGTVGDDEVILQGEGSGSDEIFVGMRTFFLVGPDVNNWEVAGMTGHTPSSSFAAQPNISPGRYEDQVTTAGGAFVPLASASMTFWVSVTGRRIVMVAKPGTNYSSLHLGFLNPMGTTNEFPYPLYVAGCTAKHDTRFSSTLITYSSIADPITSPTAIARGPGFVRTPAGVWVDVQNGSSSGISTRSELNSVVTYPAGRSIGLSPLLSALVNDADEVVDNGPVHWQDVIPNTGVPGTQLARLMPVPNSTGNLHLPIPVTIITSSIAQGNNVLGELHHVYWIGAESSILPEDTITIAGEIYRIFKSGARGDIFAHFCVKEA